MIFQAEVETEPEQCPELGVRVVVCFDLGTGVLRA